MNRNAIKVLNTLSKNKVMLRGWRGSQQFSNVRLRTTLIPRNYKSQQFTVCDTNIARARFYSKQIETKEKDAASTERIADADMINSWRKKAPTDFERKIFVWVGKYPSVDAVPPLVTDSALNGAKNKFRVYVSIAMLILTACATMVVIFFGRRRSAHGESLTLINMKKHPEFYQDQLEEGNK